MAICRLCCVKPWTLVCLFIGFGLLVIASLVIHRNVGAARARRSAAPLKIIDFNPLPHIFTTYRLPLDPKFMCNIGNGHLATDIFSNTVYMNGFYNGNKGESHRARIPAWCNVRLNSTIGETGLKPSYTLDTSSGVFQVHVDREWSVVDQRIYAHRYYTRAIINQILISAKHKADLWRDHRARYVELSFLPGGDSEDVNFDTPQVLKIGNRVMWTACGKTKTVEDSRYQESVSDVCAYWTYVPSRLVVPRRGKMLHTFVMTADNNKEVALKEMIDVLQEKQDDLFDKHKAEWKKLLDVGRVDVEGNVALEKTIRGVWYYLLSSLPSLNTNQNHGLFYGLSPGGLSRGGLLKDYEGHNFWDTEIWMFPPILLLHPQYAEMLLQYRMSMIDAASDLAAATKNEGVRFPWESAFTGREVTQPCCMEVAEFEHHITGCIAFAIRQYIAVSVNEKWLRNGGCALVFRIADFWASRMIFNETSGFYDIRNVMGPDEDHSNVTNSAFTNVVAGYALYLGEYVDCLCKSFILPKQRHWADMASQLALPFDPVHDYHPQFDGYQRSTQIKQADAVLLGFPLQYTMNRSTRANDLSYYEGVTRESGPAMTWSMHALGHLRIGNSKHAAHLFNMSYQGYVREPFKIWTEYRKPRVGAVNFLTGMGGFLQAIIFGYAGISIHIDRLEIVKPQVLPQSTRLKIHGLKYLGNSMILDIHPTNTTLTVLSVDVNNPLVIMMKNNKIALLNGITVLLYGKGPFIIQKETPNQCPIPSDLIGQKRFYTSEPKK
ncbi:protein-glucosylgalactosylhydroxylysine glucosidase-like [Arctopsyche grandis]|uniref:protein-glucosylgalactosylhydroxylysine glucosidase-like n=1 Tax=Arctopsyche grandis TaxID=121162 RepID=UPI00406D8727